MKIILLCDVKKQGKKGEIIEVKEGYGNFLIKNKQAVLATTTGVNRLNEEKKQKKEEEEKLINECEKIKKQIESIELIFKVKTGANDKVFGSISAKQIEEELKKKGFNINKKQIKINDAISSLGYHNINIELHKSVIANLKIQLTKWGEVWIVG